MNKTYACSTFNDSILINAAGVLILYENAMAFIVSND